MGSRVGRAAAGLLRPGGRRAGRGPGDLPRPGHPQGGGVRPGRREMRDFVRDAMHFRASPDGTVFAAWCTSHSQSPAEPRPVRGGGPGVPGGDGRDRQPDGRRVLVSGGGVYTAECKRTTGDDAQPRYRLRVPARTGKFYLTCPGGGGAQINTGMMDVGKPTTVYRIGDARPIATLPGPRAAGLQRGVDAVRLHPGQAGPLRPRGEAGRRRPADQRPDRPDAVRPGRLAGVEAGSTTCTWPAGRRRPSRGRRSTTRSR